MPDFCRAAGALPQLPSPPDDTPFTFAVVGDYRGDSDGNVPPVLLDIFAELNRQKPAFVLSSGDLINGYPEEDKEHIRKLWNGYRKALEHLEPPIFHVPGNHDICNSASRELWPEFWGPTHYAFNYARVRFIGLDTESDEHRVSGEQFEWLREQLKTAGDRRIFLFLHEPLFPIDGRIGTSLDAFPVDRDRLHALLVEHRDHIEGVFLGHEHLFDLEEHDGIRYYISAGGGAPLYVPEEIGGFYHYLLVHVTKERCTVELRRMWDQPEPEAAAHVVQPGELLETYEHSVLWSVWDQTVRARRVDAPARDGGHALELSFDLLRYGWPSVATTFAEPRKFTSEQHLKIEIFAPKGAASGGLVANATFEGAGSCDSPEFPLREGWNTVDLDLGGSWLAPATRSAVRRVQLTFTGTKQPGVQSVLLGDIRLESSNQPHSESELIENWATPLQWGIWDESVHAAGDVEHQRDGRSPLKLTFDFTKYQRPRLFARLRPKWDLSEVDQLSLAVFVPEAAPALKLHLAMTWGLRTEQFAAFPLRSGANVATFELSGMPRQARKQIQALEWWLECDGKPGDGWVGVSDLGAGAVSR